MPMKTLRVPAIGLAAIVAAAAGFAVARVDAVSLPTMRLGSVKPTGAMAFQMYSVGGNVGAGRLPVVSLPLQPPAAKAAARFDVGVAALVLDEAFAPAKTGFGKVEVTLYAVDIDGGESKVATKKAKRKASTGVAEVEFRKVNSPPSSFRAEAKLVGGSVGSDSLMFSGTVSLSSGGRVARGSASPRPAHQEGSGS